MIEQVVNQIIPWIINNILKIIKYKKRDENLWIFGAWGGDDYSDNSKYVFEYVSENLPNIRAVWITKNKEVKNLITNQGYKCYLYNESSGRKVRLNAKYVFIQMVLPIWVNTTYPWFSEDSFMARYALKS